jgi:hypothetical protein
LFRRGRACSWEGGRVLADAGKPRAAERGARGARSGSGRAGKRRARGKAAKAAAFFSSSFRHDRRRQRKGAASGARAGGEQDPRRGRGSPRFFRRGAKGRPVFSRRGGAGRRGRACIRGGSAGFLSPPRVRPRCSSLPRPPPRRHVPRLRPILALARGPESLPRRFPAGWRAAAGANRSGRRATAVRRRQHRIGPGGRECAGAAPAALPARLSAPAPSKACRARHLAPSRRGQAARTTPRGSGVLRPKTRADLRGQRRGQDRIGAGVRESAAALPSSAPSTACRASAPPRPGGARVGRRDRGFPACPPLEAWEHRWLLFFLAPLSLSLAPISVSTLPKDLVRVVMSATAFP